MITQTGATKDSKTLYEIRDVLCHNIMGPEELVFKYYRATIDDINENNTKDIQATIASSLWVDGSVSESYIDSCDQLFKSEVHPLQSAEAINAWIDKITKGIIKDIIKTKVNYIGFYMSLYVDRYIVYVGVSNKHFSPLTARWTTRARHRLSFQAQFPDQIQKRRHEAPPIQPIPGACIRHQNDAYDHKTTGIHSEFMCLPALFVCNSDAD